MAKVRAFWGRGTASCRIPASRTRGQRQYDRYCDGSRMLSSTSRVIASMSFEIKVVLTIKLGEPLNDVRAVHTQPHSLSLRSTEGYAVLLAKVGAIVSALEGISWPEKDMYRKPGTNTKQREFVKLSAESFDTQVVQAWRNSQRRKVALADFSLLLFKTRFDEQLQLGSTKHPFESENI
ncbi:hypothetical protein PI125_g25794 [Phytophthora idaei]|nr:hypothetical protein PI125_g25794 [Phytophthora idaei]